MQWLPSLRDGNTKWIPMAPDDILWSYEEKRSVCARNWTLFTTFNPEPQTNSAESCLVHKQIILLNHFKSFHAYRKSAYWEIAGNHFTCILNSEWCLEKLQSLWAVIVMLSLSNTRLDILSAAQHQSFEVFQSSGWGLLSGGTGGGGVLY